MVHIWIDSYHVRWGCISYFSYYLSYDDIFDTKDWVYFVGVYAIIERSLESNDTIISTFNSINISYPRHSIYPTLFSSVWHTSRETLPSLMMYETLLKLRHIPKQSSWDTSGHFQILYQHSFDLIYIVHIINR